ncbi:protoporphyrinogen/coproporphyrinogen oxidase [Microcella alkaliphila]|uniref:Protoporphyrinogen IX oxidase, aerobic, HemY n=1 Tax=Microcella alkaliphila TaxID=279828 RepID=A0A0U5BHX4_9MICO|nr:FAD-dependent oxidoreductase [Microcella alkaliphila]BAU31141.1 protoporphyrinogen IX oxidase, aerobic, HemY [Microcella alkaliphila]
MERDIVVGAGIAGLLIALRLAEAGRAVRLVEARTGLGGQVTGHTVAGIELDAGAEAFATRGTDVPDLLSDLGLDDRIANPAPLSAWMHGVDGRSRPLPAASIFGIPSAPLARDVAAVLGWRGAARAALEPLIPASRGAAASTVGELVRTRMGTAVVDRLVAPVVEGVHSEHPDRVPLSALGRVPEHMAQGDSLTRAVRRVRENAPAGSLVASLTGGMRTLTDALAARLEAAGVDVVAETRATEVTPDSVRLGGAGSTPRTDRGRVILAAPGLTGSASTATPTHLVTLVVDAPSLADNPRGTGLLVTRGGSVRARALTHATAKWPWLRERAQGFEVLRLSYAEHADVATALADASALLGTPIDGRQLVDSRAVSWTRAGRAEPHPSIPTVGEQVAGTGLAAVISHAERTAKELTE